MHGEDAVDAAALEKWSGRGVYTLVMLLVLVGFFQILGLTQISQPIIRFLNEVFEYAPRLIGPALLVVSAWIVARLLRVSHPSRTVRDQVRPACRRRHRLGQ